MGREGLEIYRRLLPQAQSGWPVAATWVECGVGQVPALAAELECVGYADVGMDRDLSGIERVVGELALAVASGTERQLRTGSWRCSDRPCMAWRRRRRRRRSELAG